MLTPEQVAGKRGRGSLIRTGRTLGEFFAARWPISPRTQRCLSLGGRLRSRPAAPRAVEERSEKCPRALLPCGALGLPSLRQSGPQPTRKQPAISCAECVPAFHVRSPRSSAKFFLTVHNVCNARDCCANSSRNSQARLPQLDRAALCRLGKIHGSGFSAAVNHIVTTAHAEFKIFSRLWQ
jgi:hypothetical protein